MDKIELPRIVTTPDQEFPELVKEESTPQETGGIKSFTGNISITSPESNLLISFIPKTTVRSPKWDYPFPERFEESLTDINFIAKLIGPNNAKDFLIESLTRHAQSLWKESLVKAPVENVTPEDYFQTFFFDINRRTGEDTPEKLGKKIAEMLKTIKNRKQEGASEVELKQLKAEYLQLKQRQDELLLKGI